MNNQLFKWPLLRIFLPYLAGILVQHLLPLEKFSISIILLFCILTWIAFFIGERYKFRLVPGILITILFFLVGIKITMLHQEMFKTGINLNDERKYVGLVKENLGDTPNTSKAVIHLKYFLNNGKWEKTSGQVLAYLDKNVNQINEPGNLLLFEGKLFDVPSPKNPGEFNYKKYLDNKKVRAQVFISSEKIRLLRKGEGNILRLYAWKARKYVKDKYLQHNINGDVLQVLSALTLGVRNGLNDEVKNNFAAAGAMHVLAVSGLHVGIIFIVINYLLFFLNKNRKLKLLKSLVIIVFLWFYAFVAGLSPSILRAATMFSFLVIGKSLARPANAYNSVFSSAFLLLIIDPYMIKEIGFQLSYLAVLGIIFMHEHVYKKIYLGNRMLDWLLLLMLVSITAQLVTFPVTMYYFHQFPVYFLIANIFILPLVTGILYTAFLFVIVSAFFPLAEIVAYILDKLTFALIYIVSFIEKMPSSVIHGINLSSSQLFLLYFSISLFFIFLAVNNKRVLLTSFTGFLLVLFSWVYQQVNHLNQYNFYVYDIPGKTAIDFIDGKKHVFIANKEFYKEKKLQDFHLKNNWINHGLKNELFLEIGTDTASFLNSSSHLAVRMRKEFSYIKFRGNKILVLYDMPIVEPPGKLPVDILILAGNSRFEIKKLKQVFNFATLIIDSSFNRRNLETIIKDCNKNNTRYYSVEKEGCFNLNKSLCQSL